MIEGEVVEIEIDRPATGSVAKTVRVQYGYLHLISSIRSPSLADTRKAHGGLHVYPLPFLSHGRLPLLGTLALNQQS